MENLTYCIDISHWNQINWAEIPDYVRVVIVKATEGIGWKDPSFEEHIEGALGSGRLVMPFHFYRTKAAGVKVDPLGQAQWFCEVTKPYWADFGGRVNDMERGFTLEDGTRYNPKISSINEDLQIFHLHLHNSLWNAFDLIYTNLGTWNDWGLGALNLWRGPKWITEEDWLDGLWLAWWPNSRPKTEADLESFGGGPVGSITYPKPFQEHVLWQVGADYWMPGSYTQSGVKRAIDFNIFPYNEDEVKQLFGAFPQPPEPPAPPDPDPPAPPDPPEPPAADLSQIAVQLERMAGSLEILAGGSPGVGGGAAEDQLEAVARIPAALLSSHSFNAVLQKNIQEEDLTWLDGWSWPAEWRDGWRTTPKSQAKGLYMIINTPPTDHLALRIPWRDEHNKIQRNPQGGIKFIPAHSAPIVMDGQYFWGFLEHLQAGSEAEGGDAVILFSEPPGHNWKHWAISPGRVQLMGRYVNQEFKLVSEGD